MNSWFDQLHGGSPAFPPAVTGVKLLWPWRSGCSQGLNASRHKDFGVRTFSLTALLGGLTALISASVMLMGMLATILLATFECAGHCCFEDCEGHDFRRTGGQPLLHLGSRGGRGLEMLPPGTELRQVFNAISRGKNLDRFAMNSRNRVNSRSYFFSTCSSSPCERLALRKSSTPPLDRFADLRFAA